MGDHREKKFFFALVKEVAQVKIGDGLGDATLSGDATLGGDATFGGDATLGGDATFGWITLITARLLGAECSGAL